MPPDGNLITSSFRIPAGDPLAAFKTTSKILHVLARAEAVERGADEALLLNTNGEVAETAGGNLFWVHDDTICTVPAECGVLPGVTRAAVLGNLPGARFANGRARHQARRAEKFRRDFHHAKRVGHRAGGDVRRRAGHAVAAGGPNRARLPRKAGSDVSSILVNSFH